MPRDDTSPPSGPPWTPAGSSFRAVLLGTQASQVGARGVPGEQSGRRPGLRDTKAVSSKGPLGRRYEGLPLSVGLLETGSSRQTLSHLGPTTKKWCCGHNLAGRRARHSATLARPGGHSPACQAGLWSVRGESPGLQVHVPPPAGPHRAELCQQNQSLVAEAESGQEQEQGRVWGRGWAWLTGPTRTTLPPQTYSV